MLAAQAHDGTPFSALESPLAIGSVTLAVRDLAGMVDCYRAILGLDIEGPAGGRAVLSSEGHHVLTLLHRPDDAFDRRAEPGLFHTAFVVPSRRHLAAWLAGAIARGLHLTGAFDHKVSEALYFNDPEGNGIEVYADRPRHTWQRAGSQYVMATDRLDVQALWDEGRTDAARPAEPIAIRVGHIHLRVGDLASAQAFYGDQLGLAVTHRRPGALWLGAGGYHHHVAVNTWSSGGALGRSVGQLGLVGFDILAGSDAAAADVVRRLPSPPDLQDGVYLLSDPSGIPVRLRVSPDRPGRAGRPVAPPAETR
jgi:catechol 2,3-dioxygenase